MCGIAGIVSFDGLRPEERAAAPRMADTLRHRGPDDLGLFADTHVVLAHTRLTIIDPVGGHQPMANETGTIHSTFNGEIYNHTALRRMLTARGHGFATRCDAEVIVHAYEEFGDGMLEHFEGMFALAVWDAPRRRLLLARDRLGVKPLYYCINDRRVAFGSELKALLCLPDAPRGVSPTALADYLSWGFVPAPRTIVRGIHKLEAAEMMTIENGRVSHRRYWDLAFAPPRRVSQRDVDDAVDAVWSRLETATAERLVADAPVGAFLSGGLDSTAVVAAAVGARRATGESLTTCTIGFDDADCDERDAARAAARWLGTSHVEASLQDDGLDLIDTLAWHCDEPLADPSALPFFQICRAARRSVRVALSGDGGDEMLAGYRRYRFDLAEDRVRRWTPAAIRGPLFGAAARWSPGGAGLPRWCRAGTTLGNIAGDGATAHANSVAMMSARGAAALLSGDMRTSIRDYDPFDLARKLYRDCDANDHLSRCQYVDIRLGLADGILAKVDRASMAHGLEVRSPMLDYRFAELAASLPAALRHPGRDGKRLLREAVRRRVGARFADRRKKGFSVPLDRWFREAAACGSPGGGRGNGPATLGDRVRRMLSATDSDVMRECVDCSAIASILDSHVAGRRDHGPVLWALVMLDSWGWQFGSNRTGRTSPAVQHAHYTAALVQNASAGDSAPMATASVRAPMGTDDAITTGAEL